MQNDSTTAGYTIDLFGNEHPAASSQGASLQLSVFDHAAERAAIDSGRPVSQERTELLAPASKAGTCMAACGRDAAKGHKLCRPCSEAARARILAKARAQA